MRWSVALAAVVAILPAATFAYTQVAARLMSGTPPKMAKPDRQADAILVDKSDRLMVLFKDEKEIARFAVSLGSGADDGPKQVEGDGRTPEGRYFIESRNPASRYHLSLRLSYPSAEDRARAEALGQSPGGDIMIHGVPNGWGWFSALFQGRDWTIGCIAVSNQEMIQLWAMVPDKTPIMIIE